MFSFRRIYLTVLAALLNYATPCFAQGPVVVLAVGANESFDPRLPKLQYSAEDARRFAASMSDVGKVPAAQVIVVTDPTLAELRAAFTKVDKVVRSAGASSKLVFYFSGHATNEGIHLKDAALSKEELREAFISVPAQARVALLDSCYASGLVRKGVETVTTFELPRASFDEPSGVVYMTATSGKEVAYESEALRGGVFTHFVLNGLYGRSDTDNDGIVTVDELYRYVYAEMRAQALTQPAIAIERPELHVDLHGRGALAMSFPSTGTADVTLGGDVEGTVYFARGGSLFRVLKSQGQPKTVQMPAGDYVATITHGQRIGERALVLRPGSRTDVRTEDFEWKAAEKQRDLRQKGAPSAAAVGVTLGRHGGYVHEQRPGAYVEVRLMTAPVSTEDWDLRLGGALSYHRSAIARLDAHAVGTALTAAAGLEASHTYEGGAGFAAALSYGESYQSQLWTYPDGTSDRFKAWAPMASVVIRPFYQWERWRLGLEARHEVLWGPNGRQRYDRFFSNVFGVMTEFFW